MTWISKIQYNATDFTNFYLNLCFIMNSLYIYSLEKVLDNIFCNIRVTQSRNRQTGQKIHILIDRVEAKSPEISVRDSNF